MTTRLGGPGPLGAPSRALAAAAGAAALVAVVTLVTWAAIAGPGPLTSGEGIDRRSPSPTATTLEAAEGEADRSPPPERERDEVDALLRTVVRTAVLLLELAVLVAAGWLALRFAGWLRDRWQGRRRRAGPAAELVDGDEVVDAQPLAEALLGGAGRRRAQLAAGEPRNAVVACWVELEGLAAAHGAQRRPWETSTDLARRCLEQTGADQDALAVLATCYLRARYAATPITREDRSRALRALDRLHASLGRVEVP